MPSRRNRLSRRDTRRGAIAVLTAFLLVAVLAIGAFFVCLSYIELTRAELQTATDAAARSAVIGLVTTQSEEEGRAAAVDIASRYSVGGKAFALGEDDVTFGNSELQPDNSYFFRAGESPTNAAEVRCGKPASSAAGSVQLPLGHFIGQETFETEVTSGAMRLDYDVCLVLDRSGSMGWDLSDQRFVYPGNQADRPLLENYFSPPHETESRWGVLSAAIDELLVIFEERDVSARVGMVTFASDYEFGNFQSVRVRTHSDLTTDFSAISAAVDEIGEQPTIGGTDIAAGLIEAETLLTTSSQARVQTAHPTIILFSDGIFNAGDDPVVMAQSLYDNHGIVIHSVTFGAELPARATMDAVAAAAGNGLSLHADTAAELVDSFRTIANSIPVLVTK